MKTFIQITILSFAIALFSANISFAQASREGGAAPVSVKPATQTTQKKGNDTSPAKASPTPVRPLSAQNSRNEGVKRANVKSVGKIDG